ncbi:helix-turn-helix domain-containing protein [Nesterenkonia suensis]
MNPLDWFEDITDRLACLMRPGGHQWVTTTRDGIVENSGCARCSAPSPFTGPGDETPCEEFDWLYARLGIDPEGPESVLARQLTEADFTLMEDLTAIRHQRGLSLAHVADRMGRTVTEVRIMEQCGRDPRMSEVRRYALAVGATITHTAQPARV